MFPCDSQRGCSGGCARQRCLTCQRQCCLFHQFLQSLISHILSLPFRIDILFQVLPVFHSSIESITTSKNSRSMKNIPTRIYSTSSCHYPDCDHSKSTGHFDVTPIETKISVTLKFEIVLAIMMACCSMNVLHVSSGNCSRFKKSIAFEMD